MNPMLFAALITTPAALDGFAHSSPEVIVEQCGHRVVADTDLDLGRELLVIQEVYTGEVVDTVEIDGIMPPLDAALELDLCGLEG